MRYKTCVTIAETSPSIIRQIASKVLQRSTYVEARLDFLRPKDIPTALEMIKEYLPRTVCTVRSKYEGGEFAGSERERTSILKLVAEYEPFLLDIEYNTIRRDKSLADYIKTTRTNMLISWHNFKSTPSINILKRRLEQMKLFSNYVKIVCNARTIHDATKMLSLYRDNSINLISFAMGDQGRITRILSLYLGSPYTYVSQGKPVAPGQFSLDEMNKIITLDLNR